jgi:membrane associated rhomboid family serine protease
MFADLRNKYRLGTVIIKLLLINVLVFAVQSIILMFFSLSGGQHTFLGFLSNFYFPANPAQLLMQPWSVVTYQFLHEPLSIWHILFNMLYLYYFGRILIDFLSSRYVLPLYITGGIFGAALYMLVFILSPAFSNQSYLLGASASILALVVAAATLVPDYTVYLLILGAVRLKYIALAAVLINIVGISAGGNAGGALSHLGGALAGYLFILSYRKGNNWFGWIFSISDAIQNKRKPRVVYRNTTVKKEAPGRPQDMQKKLDAILDKISKSGYDSLTAAEKEFLFKVSNKKE